MKDRNEPESIPSERVKQMWPQMLIKFFEKRILWKRMVQFNEHQNEIVQQAESQDGEPIEIECV